MDHVTAEYGEKDIKVDFVQVRPSDPPRSKEDFFTFPHRKGWKLDRDYRLEPDVVESRSERFDVFMQAWLFFGLIFSIVQDENGSILRFEDLYEGQFLHTKNLRGALTKWMEWEEKHPDGIWLRMIDIEFVLDMARQVVRKNCGYSISKDHAEYATQPPRHSRHLTDENALAFMTVGELLSAVKTKIMEKTKAYIPGWHGDDNHGWGPPRYVFKQMRREGWCPRAIHLLKGQLRSNATMLLAAYFAYQKTGRMIDGHRRCSERECVVKSTNEKGEYIHRHKPNCDRSACKLKGPNIESIHKILNMKRDDQGQGKYCIPIVKFSSDDPESVELESTPFNGEEFAAISHVWADGWGNEEDNTLPICHLRFIRRQLDQAYRHLHGPNQSGDLWFWMDTLVVPAKSKTEQEKKMKKRAIGQIFDVFQQAACTIVLDNGLCETTGESDTNPAKTAMTILASGWMRRLWTLQEAFGSKKLYVTFEERGPMFNNLVDLDNLVHKLLKRSELSEDGLISPITGSIRNQLRQNIMGPERDRRNLSLNKGDDRSDMPTDKAATLVANAWHAARWRTTSNRAHETLALATLLDLHYEGTAIAEAGLTKDANDYKLDELIVDFWKTFHGQYAGAIPSGIIFLPGQKVDREGFRWAPKTWMSAHELDYPDPLTSWTYPTSLETDGLLVKYPGFMLHTPDDQIRRRILGTDNFNNTFRFPSDRKLLEWYNAKPADPEQSVKYLNQIVNEKTRLAIILSRPQPGDSPPEIGLLVGIQKRLGKKFYCYIIRRLHVWRDTSSNSVSNPGRMGLGSKLLEDMCIGEVLRADQDWVVDGYGPKRDMFYAAETSTSSPNEPMKPISRAQTWMFSGLNGFAFFRGGKTRKQTADGKPPIPSKILEDPKPGDLSPGTTFPTTMTPPSTAIDHGKSRRVETWK